MTSDRQTLKMKIMECAMTAFVQHGIKAVKMDDIAQLMGISKRTLYEVFQDKEQLLLEGVRFHYGKRRDAFMDFARSADSVMDIILELYRLKVEETQVVNPQFFVDMRMYPTVVKYTDDNYEQTMQDMGDFFRRGVAEGYFRSDVNLELAILLIDAIEHYVAEHSLIERFSFKELFGNMVLVTLRGLCTLKGIHVLDAAEAAHGQNSLNDSGISASMPSTT